MTDSMIDITWVLGAVLLGTIAYYARSLLRPKYAGLKIPPFPAPKRFFTGHIHLWIPEKELDIVKDFRSKAGDIFSLDFAGQLMVVVSGHENVREVLVNHWNDAGDRPTAAHQHIVDEVNRGVLNAEGENWKAQRTTSLTILRDFGMGKNILAQKIDEEVNVFIKQMRSFNSAPVDFSSYINISVSNVICSMIIGDRFEYDDPYFLKLMHDFDNAMKNVPTFAALLFFSFLRFLPLDPLGIKSWMQHMFAVRNGFALHYVNELKQTFVKNEVPECFIHAYLKKMDQEKAKHATKYLDEKNLIASIWQLFIAGTETTGSTVYWCVLLCLHRPEVQEKVYQEILTHVGQERVPTMSDKPKLRYLDAVIREAQRMAGIFSFLPRKVVNSFELQGYTIPKDTVLLLNTYSPLNDAQTWGDPDKFRPERFFDADGNLTSPDEFMPFGLGKRACLGESLAKMELFLFLGAMFQSFRFEPENPKELPPLKGHVHIVHLPDKYKVKFVPRSL